MWRGEKKKEAVVGPRGGGGRGESSGGQQLDPEIATWILEFLIRQQHVPDRLINKLLLNCAVPLPIDPRLKRSILIRALDSDLAVTETTLNVLEALHRMGTVGSGRKLRAAYCAAAVECAVRYLSGRRRYLEAVERVWRVRVGGLEAAGSGLVGEELREWREEVEAAVWDPEAARRMAGRNTRHEAVRLMGEYLEEALAELGPPFLEVVARGLERKEEVAPGAGEWNVVVDGVDEGNVGPGAGRVDDREVETGVDEGNVGPGAGHVDDREVETGVVARRPAGKEVQKTAHGRANHVASRRRKIGAIIAESEEEDGMATGTKYDTLPSAEVNKVKKALKSSSEELHVMVKDPLPDALHIAERLAAKMGERAVNGVHLNEKNGDRVRLHDPVGNMSAYEVERDVPGHGRQMQSQNGKAVGASNPPVSQFAERCLKQVADAAIPSCSYQKDAPKQSLMERNGTAHVYEWEDSIDDSPDTTTKGFAMRRLDTPKNQAVSPLKKYEITKFAIRRPKRRWSVEEEDALREGVRKYGKGNWKFILNSRRDAFVDRTEVDLKDKWRNLTR